MQREEAQLFPPSKKEGSEKHFALKGREGKTFFSSDGKSGFPFWGGAMMTTELSPYKEAFRKRTKFKFFGKYFSLTFWGNMYDVCCRGNSPTTGIRHRFWTTHPAFPHDGRKRNFIMNSQMAAAEAALPINSGSEESFGSLLFLVGSFSLSERGGENHRFSFNEFFLLSVSGKLASLDWEITCFTKSEL